MYIYVFSEAERDTMLREGFALLWNDTALNAWVFQNEPEKEIPASVRKVASDRFTFRGVTAENGNGGGHHGT